MGALVIYESMYGNTKRVAEAIGEGLREHMEVALVEVSDAPTLIDPAVDLLVVGGPTHVHGMTTVRTRASVVDRGTTPPVSPGTGIREWLEQLRPVFSLRRAAAFDTRIKGPKLLTGSAAESYAKHLRSSGFELIAEPRSFLVATGGTLDDALLAGELDAAKAWGRGLAGKVPQAA